MRARSMIAALSMAAWAGSPGAAAGQAQAQSQVSVTLTGRLQYQWNSTSVDEAEAGVSAPIPSSTFEARRIRLGANIRVGDWITGLIEPEYALARLALKQVWVAFRVDSSLTVRAGQFKKPFNLIQLSSSTRHPVIERGVRIRGMNEAMLQNNEQRLTALRGELLVGDEHALIDVQKYDNYEAGVALEGRRGGFGLNLGVFNGTGPDTRDENDAKSFAGRATYTVNVGRPLTVGGAWSRRELNFPVATSADTRRGDAFEVDAELGGFRTPLWIMAQASVGTNLATEEQFRGASAVIASFHATGGKKIEGIEPAARVSWGDPDDTIDGDAGLLLTPGVNLYFFGRNRLMLNWDVFVPQGDRFEKQHAGRAQVNLYF